MPSKPTLPRPLYAPGSDFNQRTIPTTRQPQRIWFRVHRSGGRAAQLQETLLGQLTGLEAAVDWLDERQAALV